MNRQQPTGCPVGYTFVPGQKQLQVHKDGSTHTIIDAPSNAKNTLSSCIAIPSGKFTSSSNQSLCPPAQQVEWRNAQVCPPEPIDSMTNLAKHAPPSALPRLVLHNGNKHPNSFCQVAPGMFMGDKINTCGNWM